MYKKIFQIRIKIFFDFLKENHIYGSYMYYFSLHQMKKKCSYLDSHNISFINIKQELIKYHDNLKPFISIIDWRDTKEGYNFWYDIESKWLKYYKEKMPIINSYLMYKFAKEHKLLKIIFNYWLNFNQYFNLIYNPFLFNRKKKIINMLQEIIKNYSHRAIFYSIPSKYMYLDMFDITIKHGADVFFYEKEK